MTHPAPQCIENLLSRLGPEDADGVRMGVGEFADVRIFDGPPLADIENPDVIAIGLSIEDIAAAQGETVHGWGGQRQEPFVLTGLTQSWSGEVAMAARRARVYELLRLLGVVLKTDQTLGGACDWARIVRHTYRPVQTPSGALALIEFAIRVDATRFEGA